MLLSNQAIRSRTAVFVLVFVVVIMGAVSYMTLPREGAPEVVIPYVFISAVYEGVSPQEIENLITIPIEKKLNELENVKEISSTSAEGISSIVVEFTPDEDIDNAQQKVKDKIDLAKPDLPEDLDEPVTRAINFSTDWPILMFAIHGDEDIERLRLLGEELKDQIENVPGVREAAILGAREREIRVEIDLPRVIALNLPMNEGVRRVAAENSTVSAGNLEMGGSKFQVRVPGEFKMVNELLDLPVTVRNGQAVMLRDVAVIRDTYKDTTSISRINGRPCVSMIIKKRSGENTVRLIDDIKKIIADFQMPEGIHVTIIGDQAKDIRVMVRELENNVFTGFLFVVIVLFVVMGLRTSILVGMAIPLSMLISFTVLSLLGLTLNMIVLFSLVLSVGMLVDNAIVIVENIYRHRSNGMTKIQAARTGAAEVAWPVVTSTLTTVAAFSPLLFWPNIMGQFMSYLPKTLIVTLLASLFVAIVINPAICSVFISTGPREKRDVPTRGKKFVDGYEAFLRAALDNRGKVMLLGLLFFVFTVMAYIRFNNGVELFPDTEPRRATVEIKFPEGTDIEKTDSAVRPIEKKLEKYDDVEFYLANVGSQQGSGQQGGEGDTHNAHIEVDFLEAEERSGSTRELVNTMREDIGLIPGAEVKVDREKMGPPTGAPVSVEVSGEDFDVLMRISAEIMRRMQGISGLVDVQDDFESARPELQFRLDRERVAMLGLDTDSVGRFLRSAIYGNESSKFRAGEDEFDITLRLPEEDRQSMALLENIFIPLPDGRSVPLSSLGTVVYTGGRGSITRKDRKRVITISGDNQNRTVPELLKEVDEKIKDIELPRGYNISYTGENEEMQESGAFLSKAFAMAVGLIIVILVLQFNSVLLPAVIIMSVLLSLVGVMWGLIIADLKFGVIMTGLGIISLAGVVVNNAIVLVDCIRQRKDDGVSSIDAIVTAGRLRIRPVLLTATTTILGLIPMAVGYSLEIHSWPPTIKAGAESSDWWAPMAVAVIFGLGVATVLTLVVVPVMVSLMDSFSAFMRKRFPAED